MKYNYLGETGLQVSEFGLGAMNFGQRIDKETSFAILDTAYELGMNFIDTANAYGKSEEIIGEWLKKSGLREEMIISTKVGWPMGENQNDQGLSIRHIQKQLEGSLKRLGVNQIGVYQPHYLPKQISVENLANLFSDFVTQGKISIIGGPLFCEPWRILKWWHYAHSTGLHNIGIRQIVLSLLSRGMHKSDLIDISKDINLGLIAFGCMGGGLLNGKYHSQNEFPSNGKDMFKKLHQDGDIDLISEYLVELSGEIEIPPIIIALSWVLNQSIASTHVLGASQPDQLSGIMQAADVKLSIKEYEKLTKLSDENYLW